MKRLVSQLLLAIVLTFVPLNSVQAANENLWKLQMSDVADTVQTTNFSIEYKVLSIIPSDTFVVQLYENGNLDAQKSVTTPKGDSGTFNVTVPGNGSYEYYVRAIRNGDSADRQQTPVQTVTVSQPQGTTNTVFIRDGATTSPGVEDGNATIVAANTTNTTGGGAADNTGTAVTDDTSGDSAADENDGEVQDEDGEGEVSSLSTDDTQDQTDNEDGAVLGAQDETEDDGMSATTIATSIAGIGALIAAAYYFLFYRRSKIE